MKTFDTPLGRFDIYDTGTITRALEVGKWWDDHVGAVLQEVAGGVALDLGAHIGWFTCFLARKHSRVIALEPFPETFQLLTRNLRVYHGWLADYVEMWPVAAYSAPALLTYASWLDATDMGASCFVQNAHHPGLQVPAVRMDDYLSPALTVSVIKSDCQGADLHALMGLKRTIERCRPLIVLEWEEGLADHHGHTWTDYMDWAEHMGYSLERITPHYWDYVARPR